MLEQVHQFVRPGFAFGCLLAEDFPARPMNILAQMEEVQAQSIQFGEVQLELLADPHRSIHHAHPFVGLRKSQAIGLATEQVACRHVIAMREGDVLMLAVFAVEEEHFELLPRQVRALSAGRQRFALLAATTTFDFDLLAALDLFRIGDDRHHHPVAARVDPRFLGLFAVLHAAIFRVPGHRDRVGRLQLKHFAPDRFHDLPQAFAAELQLGRPLQGFRRAAETRGRQVHPTGHLHNSRRDRRSLVIQDRIGRSDAPHPGRIPPAPPELDLSVDGQNVPRLPAFIGQTFSAGPIVRRGEKRLPPRRFAFE